MHFTLTEAATPKRVAIMASKADHCLLDLLWRNRRGELDMTVVMVISAIATRPMLGNWHIGTIPYIEWLRLVISAVEPRKDDLS
jgi:formyltetrahydrofolate hydrolase